METVANTAPAQGVNRKLPYVKALRLEPQDPNSSKPKMIETSEAKAFPRKQWEKFFDNKGNPVIPNFNWKFIESIPTPADNDILLPKVTGGNEMEWYRERQRNESKK